MKRLVIVSNRVPVPKEGLRPGGLAVVLKDLLARQGGMWFGWNGTCHPDAAHLPPEHQQAEGVEYATIGLTPAEHRNYYTGFSNATLWPLMHSLPEHIHFERRELATYWSVNQRFCENLLPLLRPDDIIWIHDYHLLPLPALLRRSGVRQPIGFFLHTPFPAPDMLATAPDGGTFLRDLLRADLLGFQTADDTANFIFAATRTAGAVLKDEDTLVFEGHVVRVGTFPVEIDPQAFARVAAAAADSQDLKRLSGSLAGRKLIFGVDRMDPTKGLDHRLAGYERMLETYPERERQVTFLQIAAESRTEVESYKALRKKLELQIGKLNAHRGQADWTPLRFLTRGSPRPTVAGYMRLADIGYITPLRDGMNLVAKEFIAAQDPENPGVLILSRLAGAANQLDAALLVNPLDHDGMADALERALAMPAAEKRERWQACWNAIANRTALGWGLSFLKLLESTARK
ncbi:trehalose-6-phosphate synthase [Komagataeibacter sp. AV436]|uniref:Trehalose-6-phosphate synthase n=1 Tax=Komagataeibacter melomenusus TaxID=2766578 RepID=A0ABX2ADB9_9PROT|nr:trehalose-6-phosphate synthase [Komagataeibacter melomenusus]MBV1830653.1 trehalose-6-phosphate synthase [Komagataeibacter melomenusus]NPC66289.1 trehalose-6-phosphate synthase [Komagataeibacter melomenusus]